MDIAQHNEDEKSQLAMAIKAIDAGDAEAAKAIIMKVIQGEDQETAEEQGEGEGAAPQPSLKEKMMAAMAKGQGQPQ